MADGGGPPGGLRLLPDRLTAARAAVAIVAVSVVSLLFIASYAGALHEPTPRDVPIAVADQVPSGATQQIEDSPAFEVRDVPDEAAALRAIDRREAYGAVIPGSSGVELLTVPAAGPAVQAALEDGLAPGLGGAGGDVTVRSVHPLPAADGRGLVGFYTAVGWIVAGYLGATFIGIVFGTRPSVRRTAWRIGGLAILAAVVGFGGAGLAAWIGDLGNPGLLGLVGMLAIASAGVVTAALQAALGIVGTGVAILLFVVLGNPASGGPFPVELLPEPWRTLGPYIPTGAATTAIRDVAYFPDAPLTPALLVMGVWLVVGLLVALVLARGRYGPGERDVALAAAVAP
jgi:hypothetical protein